MASTQDGYRAVEGIEEAKLNDAPPPRRPLRALPFVLLALVPFGAHFFKGALSALQLLLPLSKGEYGLLHSMFALPNATIAPVLGGLLYDAPRLRKHALTLFAAVCLLGGALCAWGLSQKPNTETLAAIYTGGVVLGLGQGGAVVSCRAAASRVGDDEAFAQGVLAAAANLAAFGAKSLSAPVALYFGDYRAALAMLLVVQAFSLLAAATVAPAPTNAPPSPIIRRASSGSCFTTWGCPFLRSERFWLVALCHAIFVVVFKVFENFSSAILKTIYGYDVEKAGFVASLVPLASVLLAPAVGLASDRAPSAAAPILLAAVAAVAGFTSLAFGATTVPAPLCVGLIAISHACLPTLLLALVRDIVKVSSRGAAFGVLETVVAVGNVVAHAVFGYLAQQGLHPIKLLVGLAVIGICLFMRLVYIPTPPDARLSLSSENLMRLGGSPGRLLGNVV
jgi:predicted MFS family arabinose efflux permease